MESLEERRLLAINVAVIDNGEDGAVAAIVAQLNDNTQGFGIIATPVQPSAVNTVTELNAFDAVVFGNDGINPDGFSTFAAALNDWAQDNGGGVVGANAAKIASGFNANLFVTGLDPLLAGLTQEAARLIAYADLQQQLPAAVQVALGRTRLSSPRKMSISRLYRTSASRACSSPSVFAAMISGVLSGTLVTMSRSVGTTLVVAAFSALYPARVATRALLRDHLRMHGGPRVLVTHEIEHGLTEGTIGERLLQLRADPAQLYEDSDDGRAQIIADYRRWLEAAGIPVLVKGEEAGIWGPGFAGPTSQGITLLVATERVMRSAPGRAPAGR